ncbi:unnamed protein product [Phytophthora lilii]|uniref:Unnamed protein product n=1 Tax=Phytophthora lilii TaxID=2077276 RepID=A0A9W7CT01_9STRA|nr:unnamed protein product [Phytophthora lilii]
MSSSVSMTAVMFESLESDPLSATAGAVSVAADRPELSAPYTSLGPPISDSNAKSSRRFKPRSWQKISNATEPSAGEDGADGGDPGAGGEEPS